MVEISHPKFRKLTHFLFREMLLDYVDGVLDQPRRLLMEEFLREHPECQSEVADLRRAMQYCDRLSTTDLSPQTVAVVQAHREPIDQIFDMLSWRTWPESVRWSLEALTVAMGLLILTIAVPWYQVMQFFGHDGALTLARGKAPIGQEIREVEVPTEPNSQSPPVEAPVESPKPKPLVVSEQQPPVSPQTVEKLTDVTQRTVPSLAAKGELTRIEMSLPDLDRSTQDLRALLESLGARRGGQVPIGNREGDQSYFHFVIGKNEADVFMEALKSRGDYRLSREPHRRVMPEGEVRIIFVLKQVEGPSS
jgi:anti-sigma factor RsiW